MQGRRKRWRRLRKAESSRRLELAEKGRPRWPAPSLKVPQSFYTDDSRGVLVLSPLLREILLNRRTGWFRLLVGLVANPAHHP